MNKPEIVLPDTKINFIRFLYLVLALEDTEKKTLEIDAWTERAFYML